MVEVKILRSLKVQCLKILEQRIVESVSVYEGSKDLPPGVDLGLFIGCSYIPVLSTSETSFSGTVN